VASLIVVKTAPASASIPKPSIPEFTIKITEHSYDVSPIYGIDQFTGENITIQEGRHYEWNTLDFTIRNQQVPSDSRLYYNICYRGQYTNNWTELYHGDTYIQQQSGQYSTIPFLLSGSLPPPQGDIYRLTIPVGAKVDFQVEAMIGGIYRISPRFSSGYEFRGETSGWSNTQTVTIPAFTPSPTSPPSPDQTTDSTTEETPRTLQLEAIIGAVIAVAAVVGVGLLVYFRKHQHQPPATPSTNPHVETAE
jgi:hypothetical protein